MSTKQDTGSTKRLRGPISSDYNSFIRTNFRIFQDHFHLKHTPAVFHEIGKAWNKLNLEERDLYKRSEIPRERINSQCSDTTRNLDKKAQRRSVTKNSPNDLCSSKRRRIKRNPKQSIVRNRRNVRRTNLLHDNSSSCIDSSNSAGNTVPYNFGFNGIQNVDSDNLQSSGHSERTEIFTNEFIKLSREREQLKTQLKEDIASAECRVRILQDFLAKTTPIKPDLERCVEEYKRLLNRRRLWHARIQAKLIDFLEFNNIHTIDGLPVSESDLPSLISYLSNNQQNLSNSKAFFRGLLQQESDT